MINGAQALIRTLVDSGVEVCFMNPGTSEMHFVAALDAVPEMRGVLCLFEGGATGAADGYGRMADRPASTLLHLGPGLGNGLANLHNARRARTPIVNIVGDHATYHKRFDAPLESDIESLARTVSGWTRWSARPGDVGADAADCVAAATSAGGSIATLVLPADVSWGDGGIVATPIAARPPARPAANVVTETARAIASGGQTVLMLGGGACRESALRAASQIAQHSGVSLLAETFPSRIERGAGRPAVDRLGYLAEFAAAQLAGAARLVLVGAKAPVSFFAYPDKASYLVPDGCDLLVLAGPDDDATAALEALRDELGATSSEPAIQQATRPERPTGALTAETTAAAIGAVLPEGAIVADEGNTSGLWAPMFTAGAPAHDWLCLTGGAIGYGMPLATGAAIACPDRPVLNLESDGSALYTIQSLWTQAREGLNVTTVLYNNRSYAVLNMELNRVGAGEPGPRAREMLDLTGPDIDFVKIASGLGVDAVRAEDAESFTNELERCLSEPGPHLIEAPVPPL
jgi:acetolactate synthase-1/2/3 large subunit